MSLESSYTIPAVSPLFPAPPYRYTECPVMVVPFVADPGDLRRLVPQPLVPNRDDIAYVAVGHMHNDRLGSTHEAFIVVPSSDGSRVGNYSVFLYLEDDSCITSGREIWGWPKKLAKITLTETSDAMAATVRRAGSEILRVAVTELEPASSDELALSPVWFNHKIVPSVVEGAPPDVNQITATTFQEMTISRVCRGRGTIEFGSGIQDDLRGLVQMREVMPAHRFTASFLLTHGEVVHDYLTATSTSARTAITV